MIQKLYSVYDMKGKTYSRPFVALNAGVAARSFESEVNNSGSVFNKFPEDFALYEIAEWDDETGIAIMEKHISIGKAIDYLKKEE